MGRIHASFVAALLATALSASPATAEQANSVTAAPRSLPVGACINLGNTLEVGKGNDLGDAMPGKADFARIRAAGFETVRIPVRWHDRSLSKAPYTIEPEWLDQVQSLVDMAMGSGLNVILNSHHFDPIYADPIAVQPWHTAVWGQIAPRFKDYPTERLWFELENEPHDKFDDSNLRAVLDPALAVVRQSNPSRPVIIGGEQWSGVDSLGTLNLPDDPNVYPTFHYYSPFEFTHQGASWTAPNIPKPGRIYGSQADAALLATDLAKVQAYAARTGLMPFMGETGAFELHIPLEQRVTYTKAVHDTFVPAGVDVCQWAYANTFPLYDRATKRWQPGMLGALGLAEPTPPQARLQPASYVVASQQAAPAAGPLAELDAQLPGKLINDPTRIDWFTQGAAMKVKPIQDAAIPGGGAARRYTISSKLANPWEAQTLVPLTAGITSGQTATIGFYARTISAKTADGKGVIGVRFQQNAAPYSGFADTTVSVGSDWQWYEVSGVANGKIDKNEATVSLQLAGAAQEIEIGQAIVVADAPSILTAAAPVAAAASDPVLPDPLMGAGSLLNDPTRRNWGNAGPGGTFAERAEPKIWQGKATRYTTTAVGANPWDLVTGVPIDGAIKQGDTLLIAVAARTENAQTPDGKARVGIRIQGNTPPYDGFADNTFAVGPNWQLIRIKTTATRDFAAGTAQVSLHFAGAAQAVDIGPVYVLKTP